MRSATTVMAGPLALATLSSILLATETAHAQVRTYHPAISSVSPSPVAPGQTVTISGTDLLPPTWTATLQYHDKYGGSFHELVVKGSNSALTFVAPNNVRPDSIAIQYTNANISDALNNPIPTSERRPLLPFLIVQERPRIDTASFTSVTSSGGSFKVVSAGSHTVRGQFLLGPLTTSLTTTGGTTGGVISQPTLTTTFTMSSAPTTTFAGTALSVSSAKYIPTSHDEVVAALPTNVAHNTTGFFKIATPAGADSTRLTFARPPESATVLEQFGASTPVTNGQLVRGRNYLIRGRNLAVLQRIGSTVSINIPTLSIGGLALNLLNAVVVVNTSDTLVQFNIPTNAATSGGALTLSHAGGSVSLGSFTVIAQPAPLQISGAVISPNDIIGGTSATITLSLTPPPTSFSTAGELSIAIPSSLSNAIAPISSVLITSNPMTITVPTKVVQTTSSGNLVVSHNTSGGGSATLAVSVRPPRPTAIVVAPDTIPGSKTATATVSFDLPGAATVVLSSSDPTVASVPSTATRSGSTATFNITTTQVSTPHTITISASLNTVSVSKTIVVRPGRLANVSLGATTVNAGEPLATTLTFDAPVSGVPVAFTATDTAIRAGSISATGTQVQTSISTTKTLTQSVLATLTTTAGTVTKTNDVRVNPIQLSVFSVSPTSGSAGATLTGTIQLSRAALQTMFVGLTSSDTSVATGPINGVSFNIGESVKIVTITIRGPQTTAKSATITATLHANNNTSAASIIGTKTITVTANP